MPEKTSFSRNRPRLAITVGDVAGVGPELAMACAADPEVRSRCHPILLGPTGALERISKRIGIELPSVMSTEQWMSTEQSQPTVVDVGFVDAASLQPGVFTAQTGKASFDAVHAAVRMTMNQCFDAVVTGPIQKEAWHLAGTGYLGHTELLADLTETSEFCMMLSSETVSSVLCNIHLPLADAIKSLSVESIERAIRLGGAAMEKRHGRSPRITVLGLNPHAGENGLLSHGEEEKRIVPAIESVHRWLAEMNLQWQITGPVPPDTAFTPAMRAKTDVHICMYHDQGLIPLKALSFDDAVNVTLGLPIVRTSVDHGTALDLAWQGKASRNSMLAAIDMAIDLCGHQG